MEFDRIYEEYADAVYSYLRFKLKDPHLIEDIFQETFLSVYSGLLKGVRVAGQIRQEDRITPAYAGITIKCRF